MIILLRYLDPDKCIVQCELWVNIKDLVLIVCYKVSRIFLLLRRFISESSNRKITNDE